MFYHYFYYFYFTSESHKVISDAQNTKLKYNRGTCFGCRMCSYCGIDLQQLKCNCIITTPPNRCNRTAVVKYAFTRIFNPNWAEEQVAFIQEKVIRIINALRSNSLRSFAVLCN